MLIVLEHGRSVADCSPDGRMHFGTCEFFKLFVERSKHMFYNFRMTTNATKNRVIMGIDPGLANTGWGIVQQQGSRLSCLAYGCISTPADMPLADRLAKIHEQVTAVAQRFSPTCVGIETVWFGQNITAAFATGQARGAALVACAQAGMQVGEFSPRQIKLAVVGTGTADKSQVQYMVKQLLGLASNPKPDHAADALAAAICYTTHGGVGADAYVSA